MNMLSLNNLVFAVVYSIVLLIFSNYGNGTEAAAVAVSTSYGGSSACANANSSHPCSNGTQPGENPSVTRFREYLRIPTIQPNPGAGYRKAIEWLRGQAKEIGLDFKLVYLGANDEFALWMTWTGSNPALKSILFNSHMDVVAVQEQNWKYPPFEAHKDEKGNIFARGAVDMKDTTVGTLEAIRILKQTGFQPLRTIHVSVIPGEEIGGLRGMKLFVESKYFRDLNVGIDIDEGGSNPGTDTIAVSIAEKSPWQFTVKAKGVAQHGSVLSQFTAGQRLEAAIRKLFEFRQQQFDKLQKGEIILADLTSVNLVHLSGGIADNVIPSEFSAQFDMRIRVTPTWSFENVTALLDSVVDAARLGSTDINIVTLDFILKSTETAQTVANDSNIWWTVVQNTCEQMNLHCPAAVISAYSDGRFVRTLGIPVFGFGPFLNTAFTGHMDNEVINEKDFIRAIEIYVGLIKNLAMTP